MRMRSRKKPNNIDAAVAQRIRLFRLNAGLSQTELGNKIGVTFQQIQKYEKGTNRVGAGRLNDIATSLGVSVRMLFPESVDTGTSRSDAKLPVELLTEPYALRALQAFTAISSKELRQALVQLLERMGDEE